MTAASRRNRLIYFRISEEEFEQIVRACKAKGARNVSELARAAVQEFIKADTNRPDKLVVDTMRALGAVVDDIKQAVQHLTSTTRAVVDVPAAPSLLIHTGPSLQQPLAEEAAASQQEAAVYPEGMTTNEHD